MVTTIVAFPKTQDQRFRSIRVFQSIDQAKDGHYLSEKFIYDYSGKFEDEMRRIQENRKRLD